MGQDEQWQDLLDEDRVKFITFHPSYSYEEFIEGITVETDSDGQAAGDLQYKLKPGLFKELCTRALAGAIGLTEADTMTWREVHKTYLEEKEANDANMDKADPYVLVIDEINRGDIAKIFGELITLLEVDKRVGGANELVVTLPASGDRFCVPPNLYVIGTMNTADRSIALIDVALRRRFGFFEMNPDFDVLKKEYIDANEERLRGSGVYDLLMSSTEAISKINGKICDDKSIGRDKQIGHSFLFEIDTLEDLVMVWKYEILPLLEEYCYSDYRKINKLLFNKDSDTEWISEREGIKGIDVSNVGQMLKEILEDG